MNDISIALIMSILIFIASLISIQAALSVTIIEIAMGIIGGNFLGLHSTPWIDFLAGFASILLTFLAGAEVDTDLMKKKFKESMLIGGFSFLIPFLGAFAYTYYIAGWSFQAAEIAGAALSTTSLAVVYAVLVETGLTNTETGKILMAACFVTDLGTALALSILFAEFSLFTLLFIIGSALIIIFIPRIFTYIFNQYGDKVIEPEIKLIFLVLFLLMYLAQLGASHAVLPAFILGLVVSKIFRQNPAIPRKLRVISFSMLTPFFFMKAGMNVSLSAIYLNLGLLFMLFMVKIIAKGIGVFPLAYKYVRPDATYITLLMSTGLTFGTISSMYGLSAGIIDKTQFSLLVTAVVLSAIIPTIIAQRWFDPRRHMESREDA
ncbi:transporter, CPA2 family [Thermosyntropha lipolytica DSM 11003]|uniref:Transporter, CPA2 family n=1 Tax=Thermosyntropha lipolytica DSM 11003 TaxID=1123382 RepID=A0A1M5NNR4_9FIRM|nr:cation:proton antiporter [Thermosyntropha lipolytica]SHG90839.1 transporter, CPA2 family [Thermosyntropha lipolytica DSM 11003]